MSADYPANPSAAQSPSLPAGPGVSPTIRLPDGTNGASWSNIYQPDKVEADFIGYLMNGHYRSFEQENFNLQTLTLTGTGTVTGYGRLYCTVTSAAGGSVAVGLGKAILTPGTPGTTIYVSGAGGVLSTPSSGQVSMEFDYTPNTSFTNAQHYLGIGSNIGSLTTGSFARMQLVGSNQWVLNVNGTTLSLTGFTATLSTMQRIRLVSYSATSPRGVANGGVAITEAYVNNVLAGSVNAAQLTGYVMAGMEAAIATTGTAQVGCMTWQWNRF